MANNNNIYPLTIIRDRYCGSYSGGTYVAFNLESPEVPKEVFGDENELFWSDLDKDFSDESKYAGNGNIDYILKVAKIEQWK